MIEETQGRIDYDDSGGDGPTVVLVPGSCSTGAAWRPVVAQWHGRFRCVTTSLLGYGGTDERRTPADADIARGAGVVEAVLRRAGGPVHLVGHSFGGLTALAVALRARVPLRSLAILEAPVPDMLQQANECQLYRAFREMTRTYFAAFHAGEREAIARMIDFYGGEGTFAGWPQRVRDYAVATTAVNIRDWADAYGFQPAPAVLAKVEVPAVVMRGGASHPAMQRANDLLGSHMPKGSLVTIPGAAHFMISTHPGEVADAIARHVAAQGD